MIASLFGVNGLSLTVMADPPSFSIVGFSPWVIVLPPNYDCIFLNKPIRNLLSFFASLKIYASPAWFRLRSDQDKEWKLLASISFVDEIGQFVHDPDIAYTDSR